MFYHPTDTCTSYINDDILAGTVQRRLYNLYGDPRENGWGKKWLMTWDIHKAFSWFPENKLHLHKAFQPLLYNAFAELEHFGLYKEIISLDEAFHIRYINGSDGILSVHSWGMAIDMNMEKNPLGGNGAWSNDFIDIMLCNGIHCWQLWKGRKDPMHFAMVEG